MILEYVPGVELFDAIIARAQYTETDARPIFQQLAAALAFLHSKSIIHRDVKPENCIITEDATGAPLLKLLDFGLATSSDYGSTAKTFVGTPCYLAPEIELARGGSEESGYGTQVSDLTYSFIGVIPISQSSSPSWEGRCVVIGCYFARDACCSIP